MPTACIQGGDILANASSLQDYANFAWFNLEQFTKLFDRETGVKYDPSHGISVHWIVPGNGQRTPAVSHHDMFSLSSDAKPSFL